MPNYHVSTHRVTEFITTLTELTELEKLPYTRGLWGSRLIPNFSPMGLLVLPLTMFSVKLC